MQGIKEEKKKSRCINLYLLQIELKSSYEVLHTYDIHSDFTSKNKMFKIKADLFKEKKKYREILPTFSFRHKNPRVLNRVGFSARIERSVHLDYVL